jgi:broad specificity phosphatase PhoE
LRGIINPTILLVRHGNTTFDKKVDATLDPPLTHEGSERMARTIKFIQNEFKFDKVISSPLQRALKPSELLARGDAKVYANPGALPWNLGDLQGKLATVVQDKIKYLMDYPDLKAPHGESFRTFYNRWNDLLQRSMKFVEGEYDEALVILTHSRNINAALGIVEGLPVGTVTPPIPEGSVTKLSSQRTGSSDWTHELIWEGK